MKLPTQPSSWRKVSGTLAAALLAAGSPSIAAAADFPYEKGDQVTIRGTARGPDGKPLAGVTVLLEVSRTSFKLREMRRTKSNTLQVPAVTDAGGKFRHDWRWDGFYNTFELAAALPLTLASGESFEVLARVDVTQPVAQGSPVDVPVVIEKTTYLEWLRRFADGRAGDDERRILRQMGKPGRIDRGEAGAWTWWYFKAGKVYWFRDGALEETETFEPIPPP